MKTPSLACRILCRYLFASMFFPLSASAQLTLSPPEFPSSNVVRLTLNGGQTNVAYMILATPNVALDVAGWQRSLTGTVGQAVFDLAATTNPAMFYIASDVPNLMPTVATPVFTPGGGTYSRPTNVVVTCATDGALIHYTTNGSTPTALDTFIYNSGSVYLAAITTLKARAFKAGYSDSAVASATYTINSGPSVNAGPQQTLTTGSTTLQGFVADDGLTGGGTRS